MSPEEPTEPTSSGRPFPPLPSTIRRQVHWKVVHVSWLTAEQREELLPGSPEAVKQVERFLQGKLNMEQLEKVRAHSRQTQAEIEEMDRARQQRAGGKSLGEADEAKGDRRLVFRPCLDPETGSVKEYFRREDAIADRDRLHAEKPEGPGRYVVARVTLAEEVDEPVSTEPPAEQAQGL